MRVSIIGGTGGVGRWLVAIARENGDHVKMLVRDRRKLPTDLGAIGVIVGDVLRQGDVDAVVGGSDVVFSALGADGLGTTTIYSSGTANIIEAMKRSGATRLLAVSSVGVEEDKNANALYRRVLAPFVLKNVLEDMRDMERLIVDSGLVWTIVRPSGLTDGPRTGLYRAGDRFIPERGKNVSRADVADFMYRVVADERTIRKIVALAY
ncbi:MAG: NAD(P)-dependent oxidoreductase [Vulcanimicrobiaceae bacterium]